MNIHLVWNFILPNTVLNFVGDKMYGDLKVSDSRKVTYITSYLVGEMVGPPLWSRVKIFTNTEEVATWVNVTTGTLLPAIIKSV